MGMTVWCGETNNSDGPWSITEETPVADVLSRVCFIIAGVLGEMLYARDAFRSGSSLDETVMAQMVIGGLFEHRPDEFPGVSHPREIWEEIWAQTALILRLNEGPARDLIAKLDRDELVKGKPLRAVLRRVRNIGEVMQ